MFRNEKPYSRLAKKKGTLNFGSRLNPFEKLLLLSVSHLNNFNYELS